MYVCIAQCAPLGPFAVPPPCAEPWRHGHRTNNDNHNNSSNCSNSSNSSSSSSSSSSSGSSSSSSGSSDKLKLGWHHLSNATCLIRPHWLYALLIAERITVIRQVFAAAEENLR